MSTQLSDDVNELFDLIQQSDGIISTFAAHEIEDETPTVDEEYRRHAETHISIGDTGDFESEVYNRLVEDDHPTKGYLYGPFGYGKTSTAVSVWNDLGENDIIAVPPFTFDSFTAVMRATYGWIRYEFNNKAPDYLDELETIHDEYLQQELRGYAESQQDEYGIADVDELVAMFEDMLERGDLTLEVQADTLIDFFSECTSLALEADFDGLVVIGDEFQQYFKSADNRQDAESRFRELVFGLHSGAKLQSEFGLLISMPEQTKSTLDAQAGDVLDRLQNDNLTVNLKNVYGKDFPRQLWERYADQFGFADVEEEVITDHALRGIGEICSRPELSSGPRTVIDLFRLVLRQYRDEKRQFTALDLANAFYNGEVRYQGNNTVIQSAIQDALDQSAVDNEPKANFIKLCAVFPREGITDEVLEEYDLADTQEALSKKLHGEVIKVIAEGYTLVDVTRAEGPEDVVKEIIRKFWSQYDTDHPNAERAVEGLANKALSDEVFETHKGEVRGWKTGSGFSKTRSTAYQDDIEGTFDQKYPRRRLSVAIAGEQYEDAVVGGHGPLGEEFGDPDLAFNFILYWEKEVGVDPYIEQVSEREFTFHLDGRKRFDELPGPLGFLRDAMDPNAVTPFLMLGLVQFFDDDDTELDAAQENRIESFQSSLIKQSINALFDEALIHNTPSEMDIRRAGKRAVEGVFSHVIAEICSDDYSTLIRGRQYKRIIGEYEGFLQSLPTTAMRRGRDSFETTKPDLADRFNIGVASLEGRVEKYYTDLLKIEKWEGGGDDSTAVVRALLHPLEETFVKPLEEGERDELPLAEANQIAYDMGYRSEEVDLVANLLATRRIVGVNKKNALELIETEVEPADVEASVRSCRGLLETIEELDPDRAPSGVADELDFFERELADTPAEDGERLEAILAQVEQVEDRLQGIVTDIHGKYLSECRDLKTDIEREQRDVIPSHLDEPIEGRVKFVGSLDDVRRDLKAEFKAIQDDLANLEMELEKELNESEDPTAANAESLAEAHESAQERLREIQQTQESKQSQAKRLRRWQSFTDQISGVKEDISEYSRTFEEVEEAGEIEDLIATIAMQLADTPDAAIENLEGFKETLDGLEESFEQRKRERRDVFQEKREQLKSLLDAATDGSARGLRRATFDIHNPDESRRELVEKFQSKYRESVIQPIGDDLEAASQDVIYAQIVGADDTAEVDADTVTAAIEQAQDRLGRIETELQQFQFEDIGEETELDSEGEDLREEANRLRKQAQSFLEKRDPATESQEELLERINEQQGIDFKELLREYNDKKDEVDVDAILDDIIELFRRNQIDIKLTSRRR